MPSMEVIRSSTACTSGAKAVMMPAEAARGGSVGVDGEAGLKARAGACIIRCAVRLAQQVPDEWGQVGRNAVKMEQPCSEVS